MQLTVPFLTDRCPCPAPRNDTAWVGRARPQTYHSNKNVREFTRRSLLLLCALGFRSWRQTAADARRWGTALGLCGPGTLSKRESSGLRLGCGPAAPRFILLLLRARPGRTAPTWACPQGAAAIPQVTGSCFRKQAHFQSCRLTVLPCHAVILSGSGYRVGVEPSQNECTFLGGPMFLKSCHRKVV